MNYGKRVVWTNLPRLPPAAPTHVIEVTNCHLVQAKWRYWEDSVVEKKKTYLDARLPSFLHPHWLGCLAQGGCRKFHGWTTKRMYSAAWASQRRKGHLFPHTCPLCTIILHRKHACHVATFPYWAVFQKMEATKTYAELKLEATEELHIATFAWLVIFLASLHLWVNWGETNLMG